MKSGRIASIGPHDCHQYLFLPVWWHLFFTIVLCVQTTINPPHLLYPHSHVGSPHQRNKDRVRNCTWIIVWFSFHFLFYSSLNCSLLTVTRSVSSQWVSFTGLTVKVNRNVCNCCCFVYVLIASTFQVTAFSYATGLQRQWNSRDNGRKREQLLTILRRLSVYPHHLSSQLMVHLPASCLWAFIHRANCLSRVSFLVRESPSSVIVTGPQSLETFYCPLSFVRLSLEKASLCMNARSSNAVSRDQLQWWN